MRRLSILYFSIAGFLVFMVDLSAYSQEMPPRPLSVTFNQNLKFGAFSPGVSGGTVSVASTGIRSSTGSIILVDMGYLYCPAVFLLEGNPGSIVHYLMDPLPDATLTGNNVGEITLYLGEASAGDPIILNAEPPESMQIRIGGTLEIGNQVANPAGYYSGSFVVMFIQE
jgi:hypothetical protein